MPVLASQPARPVCFVCSSSSGGGIGARWSSPTTRSVGRPAITERAPNARIIIHSAGGAVRLARDSRRCAEVWLFASRSRPCRSQSLAAVRLARLDRRHLAAGAVSRCTFLSLRMPPFRLENIRGRGQAQPASTARHSVFAHSTMHARKRVTDVTRRRKGVVVVSRRAAACGLDALELP